MIPVNNQLAGEIKYQEQTSNTFRMNTDKEVIKGNCDGLEAMKQAIYLILNVERYQCPVVSWDYGIELSDLIGMPISYCVPECEKRITDALMQDDRINKVYDFSFDTAKKGILSVKFKVDTTAGTIDTEKEVAV